MNKETSAARSPQANAPQVKILRAQGRNPAGGKFPLVIGAVKKTGIKFLPSGKLDPKLLERLLKRYALPGRDVIIGPSVGVDCAAVRFGGKILLAKTDPITFVAEDIGFYAIHINCNDIAVTGGSPRWFLAAILLPGGKTTARLVQRIFSELSEACKAVGAALIGGHTEITHGIDRAIVIGQMLGECEEKNLRSSKGAEAGDDLILTKGIAIEAVSVIARAKRGELEKAFSKAFIDRCAGFMKNPGISIVKDVEIALNNGKVKAMHDPTEGGLSMGLYELAVASGAGLAVEKDSIPVIPEADTLLRHFNLDPMGAMASGALLAAVDRRDTKRIIKAMSDSGIKCSRIGRVTDKRHGIKIIENGKKKNLKVYRRDELTRLF